MGAFDDLIAEARQGSQASPGTGLFSDLISEAQSATGGAPVGLFDDLAPDGPRPISEPVTLFGLSRQAGPALRSTDDAAADVLRRGGQQGIASLAASAGALGIDPDQVAPIIAEQQRKILENPPSENVRAFFASEGTGAAKAFANAPLEITATIMGESFGQFAPVLGLSAGATAAGGPLAGAGAAGLGSLGLEAGAEVLQTFAEQGVDLTDERQIADAFRNPDLLNRAREIALRKGIPIAAVDMLSFGVGGRIFGPVARTAGSVGGGRATQAVAGAVSEVGAQAALGAGGEALGQVSAGQELNAPQIAAEAIGQIATGPVEIATATAGRQSATNAQTGDAAVVPPDLSATPSLSAIAPTAPTDRAAPPVIADAPLARDSGHVLPAPARRSGEAVEPVKPSPPLDPPPPGPTASGRFAENPAAVAKRKAAETGTTQLPVADVITSNGSRTKWRGPMDLITWLRTQGGLKDFRGELRSLGLTNQPRDLTFVRGENFLGPIISDERGLNLDDAALLAWQSGFFDDFAERPSIDDFLEALRETEAGGPGRRFTQDDRDLLDGLQGDRDIAREADELGVDIGGLTDGQARQAIDQEIARQFDGLSPIDQAGLEATAPLQGEILSPSGRDVLAASGRRSNAERAGNIALDRLESTEDIKAALVAAAEGVGIEKARRGVQSVAETQQLAEDLGLNFDRLMKRQRGQAFNAEQALAARTMLAESAENLVRIARQAQRGSDAQQVEFMRALRRHQAIQEQVTGITAEAGRALRSFQITARTESARQRAIDKLIQSAGGRDRIEDLAGSIATLDEPSTLNTFVRDEGRAKLRDKLFEIWINGLLSSPKTHAVNILSNTLTAMWTVPETLIASGIGAFRAGEKVYAGEAAMRAFGLLQGAKDGAFLAGRTLLTEQPSDPALKVEARRHQAISGVKGQIARLPGRFLMAEDEFFKAANRRSALYALAYRRASQKRLKGAKRAELISSIMRDPPEDLATQAQAFAERMTFTNPLGRIGQNVMSTLNRVPGGRVVVPFVRTPANIITFAAERSPFGVLMQRVRDDLKGRNGQIARDEATARMALGTSVALAAAGLAAEGLLTGGGPSDPELRGALRETGWQPYSVRIGDRYFSYGRLEPLGLLLGVAADFAEVAGEMSRPDADRVAAMIVGSVAQNLVSKTWLSGLSDLIQTINDPDRYGERYIRRLAGSLVPAGVAAVAREGVPGTSFEGDPVLRDTRSALDAIRARIPGYSKDLPPRRNVWGEPIVLSGGLGPDLISPIYSSFRRNDPIADEIVRLRIEIKRQDRKLRGVELTPQQFDQLQVATGRAAKRALDQLVASPAYLGLGDGLKRELIRRTNSAARTVARAAFLAQNSDVLRESVRQRVEDLAGQSGQARPAR